MFRFAGINIREHMPGDSIKLFDSLRAERTAIKTRLGIRITYKDMRFSLTPEGKKKADMAFITYFTQKHATDAENAPWGAKLYYRWLYLCYFLEIYYINKHAESKESTNYMQRWGYLQSANPSFVELIHGTDVNSALFAIENMD